MYNFFLYGGIIIGVIKEGVLNKAGPVIRINTVLYKRSNLLMLSKVTICVSNITGFILAGKCDPSRYSI